MSKELSTQTQKQSLSSIFPEETLNQIYVPTPKAAIKIKDKFKYVSGDYIKARLNSIFGNLWSFKVCSTKEIGSELLVFGELTISLLHGLAVTKSDVGGANIQFYKDKAKVPENAVYGAITKAYKSAVTDCIKRCAFQLGIAWDIRSKEDIELGIVDIFTDADKFVDRIDSCQSLEDLKKIKEELKTGGYGTLPSILEKNKVISAYKEKEINLNDNE